MVRTYAEVQVLVKEKAGVERLKRNLKYSKASWQMTQYRLTVAQHCGACICIDDGGLILHLISGCKGTLQNGPTLQKICAAAKRDRFIFSNK
jgi:hypothetical protein